MSTPNIIREIGASPGAAARPEAEIIEAVAHALKRCPKNRAEIASELTALTGRRITKHMVDDWLSPSKRLHFPLWVFIALCQVTQSDDLALLAMGDGLRKRAELGARAIELRSLLKDMAEKAAALRKRKKGRR